MNPLFAELQELIKLRKGLQESYTNITTRYNIDGPYAPYSIKEDSSSSSSLSSLLSSNSSNSSEKSSTSSSSLSSPSSLSSESSSKSSPSSSLSSLSTEESSDSLSTESGSLSLGSSLSTESSKSSSLSTESSKSSSLSTESSSSSLSSESSSLSIESSSSSLSTESSESSSLSTGSSESSSLIDPYFANVVSLLHFDGTDGSTIFTDVKGKTWTPYSTAALSTVDKKFGTASLLLNNTYISTPNDIDFEFGNGDFTAECWINPSSIGNNTVICLGNSYGGYYAFRFEFSSSHFVGVIYDNSNISYIVDGGIGLMIPGNWYHIALVRDGANLYLYCNGNRVASISVGSAIIKSSSYSMIIGAYGLNPSEAFVGYIDDVRITKGIARYTGPTYVIPAVFPDA